MEREIKFRAWDGISMSQNTKMIKEIADGGIKSRDIDRLTFLQYTGLKDKNGKEIYEGDIILICGQKHEVKYEGCFFDAYPLLSYANTLYRYHDESEVIGNIYENPELCQ